jgi:cytochrome c peroxidase
MTLKCKAICTAMLIFLAVAGSGQRGPAIVPNGAHFPNPGGTSSTYSTAGGIDLTGPFFQSMGTNGRSCGSCHQPSDGMSVSAPHVQQRFDTTQGLDLLATIPSPRP